MQKRNNPRKTLTMDPDALSFVEAYAEDRNCSLSASVSELILHIAGNDKANPKLVKAALARVKAKGRLPLRRDEGS